MSSLLAILNELKKVMPPRVVVSEIETTIVQSQSINPEQIQEIRRIIESYLACADKNFVESIIGIVGKDAWGTARRKIQMSESAAQESSATTGVPERPSSEDKHKQADSQSHMSCTTVSHTPARLELLS